MNRAFGASQMIAQLLVFLGWFLWLLLYWKGGLTTFQDIRAAANATDRLLLIVLTFSTMLLFGLMLAVLLGWLSVVTTMPLIVPAALVALIGIAGTFYCRARLGEYWTAEVAVQADHRVVDTGPYGVVRHPIYSFAILLYAGTAFAFLNGWTLPCAGVIIAAYVLKTGVEDRLLRASLPGYTDYCQRVKYRLLPGVW